MLYQEKSGNPGVPESLDFKAFNCERNRKNIMYGMDILKIKINYGNKWVKPTSIVILCNTSTTVFFHFAHRVQDQFPAL
jgi:predicted transcriptional regulator